MRYDFEILPTPNQENPMFEGDPGGYPRDFNNVSPRLGFSWATDDVGRSAVRGGFGVFYQRTSYTFLTNMFSAGRPVLGFVPRELPDEQHRPGTAERKLPDRPVAEERTHGEPRAARRALSTGDACA
jgi:hypothetical protein